MGHFFQTFAEMNIKFSYITSCAQMAKLKKVLITVVTSLRRNKNAAFRKSGLFLRSIYIVYFRLINTVLGNMIRNIRRCFYVKNDRDIPVTAILESDLFPVASTALIFLAVKFFLGSECAAVTHEKG